MLRFRHSQHVDDSCGAGSVAAGAPDASLKLDLQELGGALGDLGTLLPLMVALILINGLNPTVVLALAGLAYMGSGLYFRIPMPVQPLKAVSIIAISMGLSASVIGAAGLLMGAILLLLSLTNLSTALVKLFPKGVVRGIQLSIGLLLLKKGIEFTVGRQTFINGTAAAGVATAMPLGLMPAIAGLFVFIFFRFIFSRRLSRFPASLALLGFGIGAGIILGPLPETGWAGHFATGIALPSATDFWLAFTVLVIPQLPLTLGNAVVGTWDTARTYFQGGAGRVTPRALTTSMGLANVVAGLIGAMPVCHGSGGLTAHYKLGARTGGASLIIGGLLLMSAIVFGISAPSLLSLVPLPVLGVLLGIVGVYHALLVQDLDGGRQLATCLTVAAVAIPLGNLAFGFAAAILVHHLFEPPTCRAWRYPLSVVRSLRQREPGLKPGGARQEQLRPMQ